MRRSLIECAVFVASLFAWIHLARADVKDEAVERCTFQSGEFGSEMVQKCVEEEVAAAKALPQYPSEAKPIVARCVEQYQKMGWSSVKICVDREWTSKKE